MSKKYYLKFYCDEGVIDYLVFDTEAEAETAARFTLNVMNEMDPENDFYSIAIDNGEPKDE